MIAADTKITTTDAHFGYDEVIDRSFFQTISGISIIDALGRAMQCFAIAANLLNEKRLTPDPLVSIDAACFLIDAGESLVRSAWQSLQDAGVYEEPIPE